MRYSLKWKERECVCGQIDNTGSCLQSWMAKLFDVIALRPLNLIGVQGGRILLNAVLCK